MDPSRQQGVALVIVLVLLAAVSAVGVAILDDVRFAMRRTANSQAQAQAYWSALGAETLARQVIHQDWQTSPGISTDAEQWAQPNIRFVLDQGYLEGRILDAGLCINLNDVVNVGERGEFIRDDKGVEQLMALMLVLEFTESEAEGLANAIADWIDTDQSPGRGGAEDYDYAIARPAYRTGATLLADPSELRAIAGFEESVYQRLRPFVCALPMAEPAPINVNLLTDAHAPLVAALAEDMTVPQARGIIADRPPQGYESVNAFRSHDLFAGKQVRRAMSEILLFTKYYDVNARVFAPDTYFEMNSLFFQDSNGALSTLSRRFGARE